MGIGTPWHDWDASLSHVVFPILWAIGLLVFAGILAVRMRLLVAARPAARGDRIPERIRRTVVDGLGQKKFLVGEQPSGIMHALVFWGFVVLMLQVITLFGRAFDASWNIPGFAPDQPLGPPFFLARDLLEASVIVGVVYMLYRRVVVHTPRLFGLGRAEERYREAASLGGCPDPRLHPADHGRRPAVRRGPSGRIRHSRQRARLRAADRAGGRGARWHRSLRGADRQRGRLVAALRHGPGVPVPVAALQALSHPHGDPERVLGQAPAARRRAAAGGHARAGRPGGRAGPSARGSGRGRIARRRQLEAGARRFLVHRVRPLHGGLPRDRQRHAAGASAGDPRHPRSPLRPSGGAAGRQRFVRAADLR